jgi:ATP adenylyltransferase
MAITIAGEQPVNTLLERITDCSARALERGTLSPIESKSVQVEQARVCFVVRCISRLADKAAASTLGRPTSFNPVLPHDPELFVGELGDSHLCLLNKFPVFENHILLVTTDFEDQQTPLTWGDFFALSLCLAEIDGLGFYNSGARAGASQSHKHLQLVPLPLSEHGPAVPIESLLKDALEAGTHRAPLPFAHALANLSGLPFQLPKPAADVLFASYRTLLSLTGLVPESAEMPAELPPYNLLCTRRWMLLCPRSQEHAGPVSINALGFAGALLAKNDEALEHVRRVGPMALLAEVGC